MNERGQLSVDFLFATFILLVVVGSMVAIISQTTDTTTSSTFARADSLSHTIARSINEVYTNGPGNAINITLPGDFNYTVEIVAGYVKVNFNGKSSMVAFIPTASKVNLVTMHPNETYTIYNDNETITFTKIT